MTPRRTECPACGGPVRAVLERARLPIMQNVVMDTRQEALAARCAPFELAMCARCGLGFNSLFMPELLQYDTRYDNDVPSAAFTEYYRDLGRMLRDRFGLGRGAVYDVGCGKGTFLETLREIAPQIEAIGVDPSCTPRSSAGFSLIRAPFAVDHVKETPQLVLCRHVLEHIQAPVGFVEMIRAALASHADVPIYIEVPELDWIFENGAFWDFCYEHCNYFNRDALASVASRGGLVPFDAQSSFFGQYQWILCRQTGEAPPNEGAAAGLERALRYAEWERERIDNVRGRVERAAASGSCALWGMATKGVVFANIIDPHSELLAGGVDVNTKKQGRFVPGTGHAIHAPAWIKELRAPLTLIVMNPNYRSEIAAQVSAMGVHAELVTL